MLTSRNPWDGTEVATIPLTRNVEALVARLHEAHPAWALSSERAQRLRGLAALCDARRPAVIDLLIREAGKCRADAEAEAGLLARKITITLEQGLARTPPPPSTIARGVGVSAWRPRGVAVVLGPYNFPLHLLHGLVVPALAVGCTVVAKPSERCPALGLLYRDLITEAGLDPICAVVSGGADLACRLVDDPATAVVAAVGGRPMGESLHRRLAGRPEVVLALELGGVNQALVRTDADDSGALDAVAEGAWRMAGQRCTATRLVHVPAARLDFWIDALRQRRQHWLPAATPEGAVGPMIDACLREGFQAPFRELPSGLRLLAGDARVGNHPCLVDPLLLLAEDPRHPFVAGERFGPALTLCPYRDEATAVAAMIANPFRLACSVFTADDDAFVDLARRLPYGQVNRDRPTAGARSDLPFGGCGLSGNGRPAALAANAIFADETSIWG